MTLHETEPQFFRRRQESRDRWWELAQFSDPTKIIAVDRQCLTEGRELTSFGLDLQQRYADSLDEEDAAARGTPRLFDKTPLITAASQRVQTDTPILREVEKRTAAEIRQFESLTGQTPNAFQLSQLRRDTDLEIRNERARRTSDLLSGAATPAVLAAAALDPLDRFLGAPVRGAFLADISNPLTAPFTIARGAFEGFMDPSSKSGRDLPLINRLPDTDFAGNISLRDVGGFAGEAISDVGAAGGLIAAGRRAARNAAAQAEEAALRRASDDAVVRLLAALEEARPARVETATLRRRELSQRAQVMTAAQQQFRGIESQRAARTAQRGELPTADFELPSDIVFTPADVDDMANRIFASNTLGPFDKSNAVDAMQKTLLGELPTNSEIRLLDQVFGSEFTTALTRFQTRSRSRKVIDVLLDVTGIPGAVLTSLDSSFPFRQGVLLIRRPEFWKSFKPMYSAMFRSANARRIDDGIRNRATAPLRRQYGVEQVLIPGRTGTLGQRAEQFQTTLAQRIPLIGPLIKASERGYVTFSNVLRADTFDNFAARMKSRFEAGNLSKEQVDRALRDEASWLQIATGRAALPEDVARSDLMVILNRGVFSPRLNISRVQAIERTGRAITGAGISPQVRAEVLKDVLTFVGAGVGALSIMSAFMGARIELDPRSADFGKGRLGNTRIDPWGGFQQIARLIEQIRTGERKALASGNVIPADRVETGLRFARSKSDPAFAIVVDLLTGETFLGEDIDLLDKSQFGERLLPLAIQDIVDGIRDDGLRGFFKAAPALVGVGAQTFESDFEISQKALDRDAAQTTFFDPVTGDEFKVGSFEELKTRVGTARALQMIEFADVSGSTVTERQEGRATEQAELAAEGVDDRRQAFAQIAVTGQRRDEWSAGVQNKLDTDQITRAQAREERKDNTIRIAAEYDTVYRIFSPVRGFDDTPDLTTIDGAVRSYRDLFDEASDVFGVLDTERMYDELEPAFIASISPELWERVQDNIGINNRAPWEVELTQVSRRAAAAGLFDIPETAWSEIQKLWPETRQFETFSDYRDAKQTQFVEFVMDEHPDAEEGEIIGEVNLRVGRLDPVKEYSQQKSDMRLNWARTAELAVVTDAMTWGVLGSNIDNRAVLSGRRKVEESLVAP